MHGIARATQTEGMQVPGEIDGLQVPYLVAAKPPAVGILEEDRVTVGRQPAFAAQWCNPVHFIIGPVKEGLKLLPGERTAARSAA